MIGRLIVVLTLLVALVGCNTKQAAESTTSPSAPAPAAVTPDQARAIAKEAYR